MFVWDTGLPLLFLLSTVTAQATERKKHLELIYMRSSFKNFMLLLDKINRQARGNNSLAATVAVILMVVFIIRLDFST